ncbi:MAG TPA: lytic transglycosylase domain-containing protein [Saprospiraceae bacterium]|nr:lytic transglycosylase domain-containing protein [Saprospiraceae bacterium]HQW56064.1 lytic transglycosylase domain-containing protein [Saprospiraceae bacterium]
MKSLLGLLVFAVLSLAALNIHQAYKMAALPQLIKAPDLNRPFSFAGEEIPRSNPDVLDRLDKELVMNAYLHGTILMNLKLAGRYLPLIERILKNQRIPDDFKYLVPVESNFSNAVSPAGAKGFWQFMAPTARQLGLEVNDKVDERFNVEKSTYAACAHIQSLYNILGSWTLAAAAYNGGDGRIRRELKSQDVSNFYDLYLNPETSKYIFRILAIKEILNNPEGFGFSLDENLKYQPFEDLRKVQVDSTIQDLAAFAKDQGTTYRMLRYLNPWLIDRDLPVKGKTYEILLPAKN